MMRTWPVGKLVA